MSRLVTTPGQTIGPFFGFALPYEGDCDLVPPTTPGACRLTGRVLDGVGDPVSDAMVELWQPDSDGVMSQHPGSLRRDARFTGWGRAATDEHGRYAFTTVPPGPVRVGGAAYFSLVVFARGLLDRLVTRAYLPGADGTGDDLLAALPPARRRTMVARAVAGDFVFDVRLQGQDETVFLHHGPHSTP